MKLFLIILIALGGAVALGVMVAEDPGFVVLTRHPYVVRMPLILLALLLLLLFMLLYLLVSLLINLYRAPKKYRQWKKQADQNSAGKHTMQGFAGLIEGDWLKAEYQLLKKLEHNRTPLINYLGAAYAAQQQGDLDKRNHYLDAALEKFPGQKLAINLTRSRMLLQSGEFSEARICLEKQRIQSPKNAPLHRLLAEVYRALEDWKSLITLTQDLRKLKAFTDAEIDGREKLAYQNMLEFDGAFQSSDGLDVEIDVGLRKKWRSLPIKIKKDAAALAIYVEYLIKTGGEHEAEKLIRIALRREFDQNLIRLYGRINSSAMENQSDIEDRSVIEKRIEKQIEFAQSCLDEHGKEPELLMALACLYKTCGQFEKSREFYQDALQAGASASATLGLANLFEEMGEPASALVFYRKSLKLLTESEESKMDDEADTDDGVLVPLNQSVEVKDVIPGGVGGRT